MSQFSFNELPEAVSHLTKEINEIKRLLQEKNSIVQTPEDVFLTVEDTADFLKISVPTVYTLISKGDIPVMKRSKRCYFSKLELINYLKAGRKKTNSEIEAIAQKRIAKTR